MAAALAGTLPGELSAQTPGRGPSVLEIPANARAWATGGFPFLFGGESDLLFANPALLPLARGIQVSGAAWGNDATALAASGAAEGLGGGLGFGVRGLERDGGAVPAGCPSPEGGRVPPGGAPSDQAPPHCQSGGPGTGEWVATVGYGREVFGVLLGVSGHLIRQRTGEAASTGAAVDVGVGMNLGNVVLGLSAQNLGPDLELAGEEIPLPARYTLGASSNRAWVGPLDLGTTVALSYRADGEWIPAAGVEIAWWPLAGRTIVGRVGWAGAPDGPGSDFTWGAALEGDNLSVEWGFRAYDGLDGAHRIGLRWR